MGNATHHENIASQNVLKSIDSLTTRTTAKQHTNVKCNKVEAIYTIFASTLHPLVQHGSQTLSPAAANLVKR